MGQLTAFSLRAGVLLVVCYVFSSVYGRYIRRRKAWKLGCKEPPRYPHSDFLFGCDLFFSKIRAFKEKRFLQEFKERFDIHGQTFSCVHLGREAFVTNDPRNIQTVYSSKFEDYGLQPIRLAISLPFLGTGIFNTDGPVWQHSRALIRPTFTRSNVANLPAFELHLQKFLKLVATDGSTVDLRPLLYKLFTDSSTEFLFGESLNTLDLEMPFESTEFLKAFHYSQAGLGLRIQMGPFAFLHRDKKWFRSIEIAHAFADNYVDNALAYRMDFLAQEKSSEQKDDEPKGRYVLLHEMAKETGDRIELRSQIVQVFMAGHDSSSTTITNAMFLLCRNPSKWAKLRKEVLALGEEDLTFETLKSLHYLQFIIKETLRLYPVAPGNQRMALRDTVLPSGGGPDRMWPILVTKGQVVQTNTYALHRRQEFWGSEDVNEFVPERWETCRQGWHYLPFSGGPRVCPGQNLALTETAYVLARLAQEWKELICRDTVAEWIEEMKITASSANGCKLAIVPA